MSDTFDKIIDVLDEKTSARMRAEAVPVLAGVIGELLDSERDDRSRSRSTVESQRIKPKYPSLCPNCNAVLDKETLPLCPFCGITVQQIYD